MSGPRQPGPAGASRIKGAGGNRPMGGARSLGAPMVDPRAAPGPGGAVRSSMALADGGFGMEYSTIREKEEALEQIMCAEAETAFHQMNRYQMEPKNLSWCCINPEHLPDYDEDRVWAVLEAARMGDADVEPLSDEDDDFVLENPLEVSQYAPGEAMEEIHHDTTAGFRMGFHFPSKAEVKAQQREEVQPTKSIEGHKSPPRAASPHGDRERAMSPISSYLAKHKTFPAPVAAADDRPKMDRIFKARAGDFVLVGLVNGHGEPSKGEELVKIVAEAMPRAVFRSSKFSKGDISGALASGFANVHRRVLSMVDCRFSGAAVAVLLISPDVIYAAHVGDCKVLLGVPDRSPNAEEYHFAPVPLTKEHRLAQSEEFDRIVSGGGEVRRLTNDHSHRLFVKNEDFPGLTLTRSIGDRVGHLLGVSCTPTVGFVPRQDLPKYAFFCIGSSGVWATMSDRTVVNWIGSYFDTANEAARCLTEEALARWEDPPGASTASAWCDHFQRGPEPDCFSALLLFQDMPAVTSAHRAFAVGPHQRQARRNWKQVKTLMNMFTLKRAMGAFGGIEPTNNPAAMLRNVTTGYMADEERAKSPPRW